MTDGKYTGKPNAFETESAFPPVPQGLEVKKPDWLLNATNRARFDTLLEFDRLSLLDTDFKKELREAYKALDEQVEAYVAGFILAMGITQDEFLNDYYVSREPLSSTMLPNMSLETNMQEVRIECGIRIKRKVKVADDK